MVNQWCRIIGVIVKTNQIEKASFWPTAAINGSEFHAQTMAAFWPEPNLAFMAGALAAVDPKENSE